jgi:hypothetical protein
MASAQCSSSRAVIYTGQHMPLTEIYDNDNMPYIRPLDPALDDGFWRSLGDPDGPERVQASSLRPDNQGGHQPTSPTLRREARSRPAPQRTGAYSPARPMGSCAGALAHVSGKGQERTG